MVQSKYFFSDSSVYTSYFPLFCVFAPTALEMEHKGDKTKPSRMRVFILKALVVKNSVLHDFGFGKVSPAKQL